MKFSNPQGEALRKQFWKMRNLSIFGSNGKCVKHFHPKSCNMSSTPHHIWARDLTLTNFSVGLRKWSKIVKIAKNGQNGLIWSKMVQNDEKWSNLSKIVQMGPKWSKWSNMVQNSSKWSKMVQNGSKWSKMVQNGPKL